MDDPRPEAIRQSRMRLATVALTTAKFGGLVYSIYSLPFVLDALGKSGFGVWVTLTAVLQFAVLFDGGAGNALINLVAKDVAAADGNRLRRNVATAYAGMLIVACLGVMVGSVIVRSADWAHWLHLDSGTDAVEVRHALLIMVAVFFALMPLRLAENIHRGLQCLHRGAWFQLLGYALSMMAITLAWWIECGLVGFVMAGVSGLVITSIAQTIYLFTKDAQLKQIRVHHVQWDAARIIFASGTMFWVMQVCALASFQCDLLIVAKMLGPEHVAELGVVRRLFAIAIGINTVLTMPLWAAVADAFSRRDMTWVRGTFRHALVRSILIVSTLSLGTAMFAPALIKVWMNGNIELPPALVLCYGVWVNLWAISQILASLLNGLREIRFQLICAVAMAVTNVGLSIALTSVVGVSGVVWGSAISWLLFGGIPSAWRIRSRLSANDGSRASIATEETSAAKRSHPPKTRANSTTRGASIVTLPTPIAGELCPSTPSR